MNIKSNQIKTFASHSWPTGLLIAGMMMASSSHIRHFVTSLRTEQVREFDGKA
jgi:hypothetical protein